MTAEQKQTFWQHHISDWKKSSLTQTAYCKQHNIKLANFGYWRTRLNKSCSPKKLIPVQIEPDAMIRLALPSGIRLETPLHVLSDVLKHINHSLPGGR